MRKTLKWIIVVLLIACLSGSAYILYKTSTPEYALAKTITDVKEDGIDGLKPHLTNNAWKKVDKVIAFSENKFISGILATLKSDDKISWMKSKLSEIDWTVEDVLRGDGRADVVVGFNYEDDVIGEIELTMKKEDHKWKIDKISMPSFEKFFI